MLYEQPGRVSPQHTRKKALNFTDIGFKRLQSKTSALSLEGFGIEWKETRPDVLTWHTNGMHAILV